MTVDLFSQTYWNLGQFKPEVLDYSLDTALRYFVHERTGVPLIFAVRAPGDSGSASQLLNKPRPRGGVNVADWHADGTVSQTSTPPEYMIALWSNIVLTELTPMVTEYDGMPGRFHLAAHGTPIKCEPYDVIIFSNSVFKHRTPKMYKTVAATRWFARAFHSRIPNMSDTQPVQPARYTDYTNYVRKGLDKWSLVSLSEY